MKNIIVIAVLCSLTLSCSTQKLQAGNTYVVKSIKDFGAKGNGVSNDHNAFLAAASFFNARGGNGKLIIPNGTYIVGKQVGKSNGRVKGYDLFSLTNCSNFKIEGQKGCLIKYRSNLRYGTFQPGSNKKYLGKEKIVRKKEWLSDVGVCIKLRDCQNIDVVNLHLNGNAEKCKMGGKYGDNGIQAAYTGISLYNSRKINIINCDIKEFGLDGIYIAHVGQNVVNNNILINQCKSEYNGRQGLSIVGGMKILIKSSSFNYTGRGKVKSNPRAGVDIEPNRGSFARNIIFKDCNFLYNQGVGLVSINGIANNVRVQGSTFIGDRSWTTWIKNEDFQFESCKFYGAISHACDAKTNADRTAYFNCYFSDTTFKTKGGYLAMISTGKRQLFDNCTFSAKNKKLISHKLRTKLQQEYTVFKNCKFSIQSEKLKKPKDFMLNMHHAILDNNSFYTSESKYNLKSKKYIFSNTVGQSTNKYIYGRTKD